MSVCPNVVVLSARNNARSGSVIHLFEIKNASFVVCTGSYKSECVYYYHYIRHKLGVSVVVVGRCKSICMCLCVLFGYHQYQ